MYINSKKLSTRYTKEKLKYISQIPMEASFLIFKNIIKSFEQLNLKTKTENEI